MLSVGRTATVKLQDMGTAWGLYGTVTETWGSTKSKQGFKDGMHKTIVSDVPVTVNPSLATSSR